MNSNIKNSFWLKLICYITLPIMIAIIMLNIIVTIIKEEKPEFLSVTNFYETNSFTDTYSVSLQNIKEISNNEYNNYDTSEYITSNGEKVIYNISTNTDLDFLFVDNLTKTAYTNLDITSSRDTLEELIYYIKDRKEPYWNYVAGDITTSMSNLRSENISYSSGFYKMIQNLGDNQFYSSLKGVTGDYKEMVLMFNIAKYIDATPYVFITIVLLFLSIVEAIYLLASIGYKSGHNGIHTNWIDKIPLEIFLMMAFLGLFVTVGINGYIFNSSTIMKFSIAFIIQSIVIYVMLAIAGTTIVKRLKAHTLIQTTVIYIIYDAIMKVFRNIFENANLTFRIAILYGGFLFVLLIASIGILNTGSTSGFLFFFFGAIAFMIYVFMKILNYFKRLYKIKGAIENIYNGNNQIILKPEELKGEQREIAVYINDIAGGLSNAIEQSIKSERFKTELITNVSHDIKTPLTSIINYVDLLKQENIDNEKVKEYIDILDTKSQRLKKLTEDLVEASKASSGNVKLAMEKISVLELIKQATGEFEDKFNKKGLEIIVKRAVSEDYIMADNRYIYRVIENLFSNMSKYALENSRVYIDIVNQNNKVIISIKNISKEPLNISADELMQRFVRGDRSRATEGSGLGLSISRSLTELQGGIFSIQVDGDLFKVEMIFKSV